MFEQAFKNIDNVLRKEAGCTTELDYTEQTSWMLFLKYLDGLEQDRSAEAALVGEPYSYIIDRPYRWDTWAAPKDKSGQIDQNKAMTGADLTNFAFVINRSPQPHALAVDFYGHFIQVPSSRWIGSGSSKILGEEAAEFQGPTTDCLVADVDAALGQHFLDIAKAEGEPEVEPDGLPNDVGREPVALERDCLHGHSPIWGPMLPQSEESLELN